MQIDELSDIYQQPGVNLGTPAIFYMTTLLPYGWNQPASVHCNHRQLLQLEQTKNSTVENEIFKKRKGTKTKEQQYFRNGTMEFVPYQFDQTNDQEEWEEKNNGLPIETIAKPMVETNEGFINAEFQMTNILLESISYDLLFLLI